MKLIELIQEIGEANPNMAYPYELDIVDEYELGYKGEALGAVARYEYTFTTEGKDEYAVKMGRDAYDENKWDDEDPSTHEVQYDISFAILDENGDKDFEIEPNKGELYRVMATVVKIIKERIKEDETENDLIPKSIYFEATKTKGKNDKRREKLYAAYAKAQLPNSKIKKKGKDGIEIMLNK